MRQPKNWQEVAERFSGTALFPQTAPISLALRDVDKIYFPPRTLPYWLTLLFVGGTILEALFRNRKRHYCLPGHQAPTNRLYSFDKITPAIKRFKFGRARHEAILQICHHNYGIRGKDTLTEKIEALWSDLTFNTDHALGLIGRHLLVSRILTNVFSSGCVASFGSIACGAGEAVIQALVAAQRSKVNVKAGFFDINEAALELVAQQLSNANLFDQGEFYRLNVIKHQSWFANLPLDGLELIGIIDYIPDEALIGFLRCLKNPRLKFLISGNILKKPGFSGQVERAFLRHTLQWPMHYRAPEQLRRIFQQAGYENTTTVIEPRKLFAVILWSSNVNDAMSSREILL